MMEYATYSVISPEGCASILWRDDAKKPEAAEAMKMTATDLLRLGITDEIIPEPPGGAHRDHDMSARHLGDALRRHLADLLLQSPEWLREDRYRKFRGMGAYIESGGKDGRPDDARPQGGTNDGKSDGKPEKPAPSPPAAE
jgi:acetyl-CoA carboxylase carboxyl transferase subunit alpha